jgi:hypothetical protein
VTVSYLRVVFDGGHTGGGHNGVVFDMFADSENLLGTTAKDD